METCKCDEGWNGTACDIADCSGRMDCNGKGLCIKPNTCDCFNGYEDDNCSTTSPPNTNPPVFNETEYNVTIYENTKSGIVLIQLIGNDIDSGVNGELRYSIDLAGLSVDIPRYLMIHSISGEVILIEPIPRDVIPSGILSLSVVVRDKGSPSFSDKAVLNIFLVDINNHCPVFSNLKSGDVILVNGSASVNTSLVTVKAKDADYDQNGEIKFSIVDGSNMFEIDEDLGVIFSVIEPIPVGKHTVTVIATDQAIKPCVTDVNFIIQVYPSSLQADRFKEASPSSGATSANRAQN